ncbi:sensor histidine kinase [Terrimonas ferruginea]|uniref:sensor histidine kinase n=1 Tax=Terrimonas ferruginea TaxID=249 RepID=UPI000407BCD8|nr:sensor histidine kinase [Terrimonas ferruginea]
MYSFLPGGNKKFWIVATHVAAWFVYIGFLYAANKLSNPSITIGHAVLFMLPFCAVFYTSVFWINRYKKIGPFFSVASFVGTFLILAVLTYAYMYRALPSANVLLYKKDQFREFIKYSVLGYAQYYSYALLYFVVAGFFRKEHALRQVQEEKYKKDLENARLKEQELTAQKEKLQIEYAFLRAQVNPHFLHNTLNTLYSQAQEYSETLASNISKLSSMMRYSFENINYENDSVPIEKELKNLNRLIEINNIRHQQNDMVDFQITGDIQNQMLPPLSLISIVENAFKYGDFSDPEYPLVIRLTLLPDAILFYCQNKIKEKSAHNTSHNIGILNLRKRLDVLYKKNHSLSTKIENGFYSIELSLKT